MTEPRPPRLALWVLLPILIGITLAGEYVLFLFSLGAYALVAPAIAAVIGLVYLAWAAPARPVPAPAGEDDEPFDDPVEEAVRADAGPPSSAPAVPPSPDEEPAPGPPPAADPRAP